MSATSNICYISNPHNAKEWQAAILKYLSIFDTFCKQHNISYSLCFGGLLGTVRHRNIIPWDNDVDVVMNIENYKKLLKLFLEGKFPENFALTDYELDPNCPLLSGRFINIKPLVRLILPPLMGANMTFLLISFLFFRFLTARKKTGVSSFRLYGAGRAAMQYPPKKLKKTCCIHQTLETNYEIRKRAWTRSRSRIYP